MTSEENTFSEEHMKDPSLPSWPSWKEWFQENKIFILVIGLLSAVSLGLLFQTLFQKSPEAPLPTPTLSIKTHPLEPSRHLPPRAPYPFSSRSPLEIAQRLYKESKVEEAIRLLLQTAHTHSQESMREEASRLAKKYHEIQYQKIQIQKFYLQGYVLFHTYPKEACREWAKALTLSDDSIQEDSYYQKTQKRWNEECKNY